MGSRQLAHRPRNISQVTSGTLSAAGLLGGSASASLAFSGTPADGDQITIGGTQYTFHTSGSFGGTTANDVLIDGNSNPVTALQNTLANLVAAVNGGPGAGTVYGAGTTVNNEASASSQGTAVFFQATPAGNAVIAGGGTIAATVDTGTVETFLDTTPFASGSSTSLANATNAQALEMNFKGIFLSQGSRTNVETFRRCRPSIPELHRALQMLPV